MAWLLSFEIARMRVVSQWHAWVSNNEMWKNARVAIARVERENFNEHRASRMLVPISATLIIGTSWICSKGTFTLTYVYFYRHDVLLTWRFYFILACVSDVVALIHMYRHICIPFETSRLEKSTSKYISTNWIQKRRVVAPSYDVVNSRQGEHFTLCIKCHHHYSQNGVGKHLDYKTKI